jgi:hypothetical protein
MSTIAPIVVAALSLNLVWVLLLIWRCQEGYEDESGFHLGSVDELPDIEAIDAFMGEQQKVISP